MYIVLYLHKTLYYVSSFIYICILCILFFIYCDIYSYISSKYIYIYSYGVYPLRCFFRRQLMVAASVTAHEPDAWQRVQVRPLFSRVLLKISETLVHSYIMLKYISIWYIIFLYFQYMIICIIIYIVSIYIYIYIYIYISIYNISIYNISIYT